MSSSADKNFFFLFCLGFEDGGCDLGSSTSVSSSSAFLFLVLPTCGATIPDFFLVPATKRLNLTGRWGGLCTPAAIGSGAGDTSLCSAAGAAIRLSRDWLAGRAGGADVGETGAAEGTAVADADAAS